MTTEAIKSEFADAVDRLAAAGLLHNIVEIGVLAWMADRRGATLADGVSALVRIGEGDLTAGTLFGLHLSIADDGSTRIRWLDDDAVPGIVLSTDDPIMGVLALGLILERKDWGSPDRYVTPRTAAFH